MLRTRSSSRAAAPFAALLLCSPLVLTGCGFLGSSNDDSASKSPASSTSSTSSLPTASGPGEVSPTSATSTPQDASGKPSKDEVRTGLQTYYTNQGLPAAAATTLAGCMVDEGYDKLSAKSLNAMKDGKPESVDPADMPTFTALSSTCTKKLTGGVLPTSLPSNLPLPS